jgi:ribosomal protein L34E
MDSPCKNRKYCSRNCAFSLENWIKTPSFTTVRKYMIKRNMIEKCENCGYDEFPHILGVHHKDENRENNSIENLAVLCPICHSLAHNKHICH